MRRSVRSTIKLMIALVACLLAGCASGRAAAPKAAAHPIVGKWTLDLAAHPAAAAKPERAAWIPDITFQPDGRYERTFRPGTTPPDGETEATYRIVGDDVYTTIDGREGKLLWEIRGSRLFIRDD